MTRTSITLDVGGYYIAISGEGLAVAIDAHSIPAGSHGGPARQPGSAETPVSVSAGQGAVEGPEGGTTWVTIPQAAEPDITVANASGTHLIDETVLRDPGVTEFCRRWSAVIGVGPNDEPNSNPGEVLSPVPSPETSELQVTASVRTEAAGVIPAPAADDSPDPLSMGVDGGQPQPSSDEVPAQNAAVTFPAAGQDALMGEHKHGQSGQQQEAEAWAGNEPGVVEASSAKNSRPQKTIADWRPHCQNPKACASYKLEHCAACARAAGLLTRAA